MKKKKTLNTHFF